MAFNVAIVTYLIYHMYNIGRVTSDASRRRVVIICGIMLLLAPFAMLFRFIPPTPLYFLIYPAAIGLFIYMTGRQA